MQQGAPRFPRQRGLEGTDALCSDDGNTFRLTGQTEELFVARRFAFADGSEMLVFIAEEKDLPEVILGILESTQKGDLDVTEWLVWFLDCLGRAIAKANTLTAGVLAKDAFWRHLKQESIEVSERQRKIINLLLDGFEGN